MSSTIVFWGRSSGCADSGSMSSWLTMTRLCPDSGLDFLQHLNHEKSRLKVLLAAKVEIRFSEVVTNNN